MDEELVAMLTPFWTPKLNYTATPAAAMLTNVFWDEPVFGPVTAVRDRLSRTARVVVYSYDESKSQQVSTVSGVSGASGFGWSVVNAVDSAEREGE
jgi:hypothetical protein